MIRFAIKIRLCHRILCQAQLQAFPWALGGSNCFKSLTKKTRFQNHPSAHYGFAVDKKPQRPAFLTCSCLKPLQLHYILIILVMIMSYYLFFSRGSVFDSNICAVRCCQSHDAARHCSNGVIVVATGFCNHRAIYAFKELEIWGQQGLVWISIQISGPTLREEKQCKCRTIFYVILRGRRSHSTGLLKIEVLW